MVVITNFAAQPGVPLILESDGTVSMASMDDPDVVGLAVVGGDAGTRITVVRQGPLEIADWTYLTGTSQLLVGSLYYLGANTFLTATPPTEGFLVELGRAFTPTVLDVNIKTPIFF